MGDLLSCDVASLNCRNQRNTENVSASISYISVPTPVIGPPEAQNRKMHTVPQFVDSDAPLAAGNCSAGYCQFLFLGFSDADKVCQLSPQATHSVARMKSQGGSIDSFVHGLIKVELAAGRRENL